MNLDDFPAPKVGFVLTHVLVVADPDRSRDFYQSLLGGQVLLERDPVIIKVANTWLTLVTSGGPTDDKPGVSLSTLADPRSAVPPARARAGRCWNGGRTIRVTVPGTAR
jgi:lactoylglutathione lyase